MIDMAEMRLRDTVAHLAGIAGLLGPPARTENDGQIAGAIVRFIDHLDIDLRLTQAFVEAAEGMPFHLRPRSVTRCLEEHLNFHRPYP